VRLVGVVGIGGQLGPVDGAFGAHRRQKGALCPGHRT
jgi:hypothetical protein